MRIPIKSNYYGDGKIYTKNEVDLQPGLTVLVGCNGSGKTTLIRQIEQWCKKDGVRCFKFDNYHEDNNSKMNSELLLNGDFEGLARNIMSSEGEQISNRIGSIAGKIGQYIHYIVLADNKKQVVLLFDALDSGLSIDHIIEFKQDLLNIIIDDCTKSGLEVYIIVSANEYEMARGEQCLDMTNLQYKKLPTYNSYRKLIIKSRKRKNRRYKWEVWDYDTT